MADVHLTIDAVPTCHELVRMPHQVDVQRRYEHGVWIRGHQIQKAVQEDRSEVQRGATRRVRTRDTA